jgi:hypothetical protein
VAGSQNPHPHCHQKDNGRDAGRSSTIGAAEPQIPARDHEGTNAQSDDQKHCNDRVERQLERRLRIGLPDIAPDIKENRLAAPGGGLNAYGLRAGSGPGDSLIEGYRGIRSGTASLRRAGSSRQLLRDSSNRVAASEPPRSRER